MPVVPSGSSITTPVTESAETSNTTEAVSSPVAHLPPVPQSVPEGEALPKYRRDLVAKQKILRAELTALQPQSGHCRLEVSRTEIFEVFIFVVYVQEPFFSFWFLNF